MEKAIQASLQHQVKPRVNAGLLPQFKGRHVLLVATVQSHDPATNSCDVVATDGGVVKVFLNSLFEQMATLTEFCGIVAPDGKSLQEVTRTDLSDGFDFANYEQLLQLMHGPFRHLFVDN
eukprot:TRINITY_DN884_c0_g1_i1.p1 TRINITY_DN884_c0_g1~~TRINITY_DN884_c0_g1_i1.p1  ORF type:complete len:132 (-),score=23.39 TRINITY_DN884_c0_g1_i1:61-420(-)